MALDGRDDLARRCAVRAVRGRPDRGAVQERVADVGPGRRDVTEIAELLARERVDLEALADEVSHTALRGRERHATDARADAEEALRRVRGRIDALENM